jgi:hypothetical protein
VLLSDLLQERVSYFTVYMLLLQNATIAKHNMRINILESGGLANSKKLMVDKATLTGI